MVEEVAVVAEATTKVVMVAVVAVMVAVRLLTGSFIHTLIVFYRRRRMVLVDAGRQLSSFVSLYHAHVRVLGREKGSPRSLYTIIVPYPFSCSPCRVLLCVYDLAVYLLESL